MADVRAILKINDEGNGELDSFTTSIPTNNLSIKPYSTDILSVVNNFSQSNKNFGGARGTPIGLTTIEDLRFGVEDSNNVISDSYKGLDFGYTDSNGVLNLTITIVGTDIISFKIVFDRLRNQYPTSYSWIDVTGTTHNVDNNTSCEITFEQRSGYGTTVIYFSNWSLPNEMVGITYIENIEIDLFLNKQWIDSFESYTQFTSDGKVPNFTPIANTGRIVLKDVDGTLQKRAELGHLNTNIFSLEFYLNSALIQEHISTDTPYFTGNNTISIELSNEFEKWNDIIVPEHTFTDDNMYHVLKYILDCYETDFINRINIIGRIYINGYSTMLNWIFNHSTFTSLTLKEGTLMEQITKVCTALLLNCYVNDNGRVCFRSARPIVAPQKTITDIPFKNQYSKLEYDILVKNSYDEVEIK